MAAEPIYALEGKRVWVAGHRGMVGAALVRRLASEGCEILTADRSAVDLRRQEQVERFVAEARPQAIFMAAAKVGGILANDRRPAEFIYDNLIIETNVTEAAWRGGVEKMLFLGSSCIYPKLAPQPIPEEALLTGPLEPTNQWYAVAKIAGIKLAQAYRQQYGCDFISAMPTNLYGSEDNFDLTTSHVLPALIRKAHEAKMSGASEMTVLGSGRPLREFLHVDDCADGLVFLMRTYTGEEHVNVGYGEDISIAELARLVAEVVGFKGRLTFDLSAPDGTPRKLMDPSRLQQMGWSPKIGLQEGVRSTYDWYRKVHRKRANGRRGSRRVIIFGRILRQAYKAGLSVSAGRVLAHSGMIEDIGHLRWQNWVDDKEFAGLRTRLLQTSGCNSAVIAEIELWLKSSPDRMDQSPNRLDRTTDHQASSRVRTPFYWPFINSG